MAVIFLFNRTLLTRQVITTKHFCKTGVEVLRLLLFYLDHWETTFSRAAFFHTGVREAQRQFPKLLSSSNTVIFQDLF